MPSQKEKGISKRVPVIVVMGHIDHGKSTLLDYIRKRNTVNKEVGGITQHVGAYEANYTDKAGIEHRLTFLDTPGHEAFCTIRERGTKTADIAILVISGEEGVKPQTLEALSCIKTSKIPYLIAINKIDRPNVDIERIKGNLAENEIYVEGYGGDVPSVAVSAVTGKGVPDLLEMLTLMADIQNLTTDASKKAEGFIIEAHVDQKCGTTATLVIKDGTLSTGEFIVSGDSFSPVRRIENYDGKTIKTAGAGTPVIIVGWNKVPVAGAAFDIVDSKKEAESLIASVQRTKKSEKAAPQPPVSEEENKKVVIPLVIKADAVGSLEAIEREVKKIAVEGVQFKILLATVGTINENDVKTASAGAGSAVLGFNVKIDASAKAFAERFKIPVMTFDIIYRLTEWLQEESEKRRPRVEVEEETGRAKILKIFSADKDRFVIGGKVESGSLKNGSVFKLMRRDSEISRGKIRNLQQQKEKVDEVGKDTEFGALIESKLEPVAGDRLETFSVDIR